MKIKLLTLIILLSMSVSVFAADQIYTSNFNNRAVGGYDAVSYFQNDGPIKGKKSFKTQYLGAEWRFASQQNLDAFKTDPEKYAPAFGGYCAWAVSHGYTAKGDPRQWTIHEGRLYLNYNAAVNKQWRADKENRIILAERQWPAVIE